MNKPKRLPGQPKRGALPAKLDWKIIDQMLHIQCIGEEVASVLGISYDTLERCCKRDKKRKFADYSEEKKQGGRASLRRKQWAMVDKNVAMAIWLGKVMLGQKDSQEIDFGKNSLHAIGKMASRVIILPSNGRDQEPVKNATQEAAIKTLGSETDIES